MKKTMKTRFDMEYSFRPWRQKKSSFHSYQRPVCGICGHLHSNVLCFAFNQGDADVTESNIIQGCVFLQIMRLKSKSNEKDVVSTVIV